MRIVSETVHPACKVTVYHWNNRYLIKVEQQDLEQTFKVSALDVSEPQVALLITPGFLHACLDRFDAMRHQLSQAVESL